MNTIIYTIKYQYIFLLKQSRRGIYLKACLESYMALVFNCHCSGMHFLLSQVYVTWVCSFPDTGY